MSSETTEAAEAASRSTSPAPQREQNPPLPDIHLKDPAFAAFLAWLIPGLGHLYQGRLHKVAIFFICIMGTFIYGLYLGDGRVVYASWSPEDTRLPYLCQVGVGLPALPALVQNQLVRHNKQPYFGGIMAPPQVAVPDGQGHTAVDELDLLHRTLHRYFELGTVFTMVAGLLNVLAIYDAWGGPAQYGEEPKPKASRSRSPPAASK